MKTPIRILAVGALLLSVVVPELARAQDRIIYVNQGSANSQQDGNSWATAYHELRNAITNGGGNPYQTEYWVAAGTYKPTSGTDRTVSFALTTRMVVRGGFAGTESYPQQRRFGTNGLPIYQTVLSGDIGTPATNAVTAETLLANPASLLFDPTDPGFQDNSYNVVTASGHGASAEIVLDGLIIANGDADPGTNYVSGSGVDPGTIPLMTMPDPSSQNSTGPGFPLTALDTRVAGGGLAVVDNQRPEYVSYYWQNPSFPDITSEDDSGDIMVQNCLFINDRAVGMGGAVACYGAQMLVIDSSFWLNEADYSGGAFWGCNQNSVFNGCNFAQNVGGRSGGAVQCISLPGYNNIDFPWNTNAIGNAASYIVQLNEGLDTQIAEDQSRFAKLVALVENPPLSLRIHLAVVVGSKLGNYGVALADSLAATAAEDDGIDLASVIAEASEGSLGTVFAVASAVVSAGQGAVALAEYLGVSPNNPTVVAVSDVLTLVSDRTNPIELLYELSSIIAGIFAPPGPTYEQSASGLWAANQSMFCNYSVPTVFYNCQFLNNTTFGMGGAFASCYNNEFIENCLFQGNNAVSTGGAVAFSGMGAPVLFNDGFFSNNCAYGASAIVNFAQEETRIINCTILSNNTADATQAAAVDNETGANVVIGNSILWGNTVSNGAAGIDVFTAKYSDLNANEATSYNAAGNSHWQWVAVCDIRNSDVQSLSRLEIGTGQFVDSSGNPSSTPLAGDNNASYATGYYGGSDTLYFPVPVGAIYTWNGYSPPSLQGRTGYPNVGEGNRETMLNPAYGNISIDPHLDSLLGSFPNSPGLGKGNSNLAYTVTGPLANYDLLGFSYSGRDMGATQNTGEDPPGFTYYVNGNVSGGTHDGSSWANAATTLSISPLLVPGDSVWVAAGTYTGNFTVPAGVSIYGGFAGNETSTSQSNPSQHPTIIKPYNQTNALTVLGGNSVVEGLTFSNASYTSGGPVSAAGPAVVENCFFMANYAPQGALHTSGSTVTVSGCNFTSNNSSISALYSSGSSTIVQNCRFDFNLGTLTGGCYLAGSNNSSQIWGSEFYQNTSITPGGGFGGGIGSQQASLSVQNCTIYGNRGLNLGGGICYVGNGTCQLLNSIVYSNTSVTAGTLEYQQVNQASQIQNCILQGLTLLPSVNSLDVSPQLQIQFAKYSLVNGLLPIQALQIDSFAENSGVGNSLAINAGASNYSSSLFTSTDAAGNPRIVGGVIDIGAYEYQGTAPSVIFNASIATTTECGTGGMPTTIFTASPSVPNYSSARWQVDALDGNGFTDLIIKAVTGKVTYGTTSYTSASDSPTGVSKLFPDQDVAISGSELVIVDPPLSMSGYQFRLWNLGGQSGSATSPEYVTAPASISQYNALVYVNAAAIGNNDGTSWANAFTDLNVAIASLGGCGQIWVATGTYNNGAFIPSPNELIYGGFSGTETNLSQRNWQAHPTILQPGYGSTLQFTSAAGTNGTLVDGFYLQQTIAGPAVLIAAGSPTVQNCVLSSVAGNTYGASIAGGAGVTFSNCQFLNYPKSALVTAGAVTLQSCLFYGNTEKTNAGAITGTNGARITAVDCAFENNIGTLCGAVRLSTGAPSSWVRCSFTGNRTTNGPSALAIETNTAVIDNCLFASNTTQTGKGTIQFDGTNLVIVNSTVANNMSYQATGGLDATLGTNITIWNSIFWGNSVSVTTGVTTESMQIDQFGAVVSNSIIQGLSKYVGNNNISYAPLFANDAGGNYQLTSSSPAINAGSASAPHEASPELDLLDNARQYNGGLPDIGCYEFQGAGTGVINLVNSSTTASTCGVADPAAAMSVVAATGSNYTYQWYAVSNSVSIPLTNSGYIQITQSGPTNTLTILNPDAFLGYEFQAVVNGAVALDPQPVTFTAPSVVYVNAAAAGGTGKTWATAFKNLPSALASITNTCTAVWVAKGTYQCGSGVELIDGVAIYGGFNGTETNLSQRNFLTNISILAPSTTNSAATKGIMVTATNLLNQPFVGSGVLDGFQLTANGVSTSIPALIVSNAAPIIQNCTFVSNNFAVSISNSTGAYFYNCTFTNNTNSSMAVQASTNLQLFNCQFLNGRGVAGLTLTNSAAGLTNCVISSNTVPNSQPIVASQSALIVQDCIISNNSGFSALSAYGGSVLSLNDSVVVGNVGTAASSAIYGSASAVNLLNDTVVNNSASGLTGGLWIGSGSASIVNTILWGNTTTLSDRTVEQAQMNLAGSAALANSIIQGLFYYANSGPGLLSYDPVFVNPAVGNYQLTSVSPAVGAGQTNGISAATVDLLGHARLFNGVVDIGAYAFGSGAVLPAYLNYALANSSVCRFGGLPMYVYNQNGGALSVTWQVNRGTGFGTVTNDANDVITTTANGSSLTLENVQSTFSGYIYRFITSGSVSFTSPSITITVNPQPIVYVDANAKGANNGTTWSNAYNSLATAIGASGSCDAIYVATGTYSLSGVTIPPGVEIDGGFTNGGTSATRNPATHTVTITTAAGTPVSQTTAETFGQHTILDGLTFGNASSLVIEQNGGSPIIRNCAFLASSLTMFPFSSVTISNTYFNGVGAGAAIQCEGGNVTMLNSAISNCIAGVYGTAGTGAFLSATNCRFINNSDPVNIATGGTFDACAFIGNSSPDVAPIYVSGTPTLFRDCLMASNSGGPGAIMNDTPIEAVNCTIVSNLSGGIANYTRSVSTLANCIIWGNVGSQLTQPYTQALLENDIMNVNPMLNGDYTLSADSPAINAGNNAYTVTGETDLAGNARIQGGTVDVGAYEAASWTGSGPTYGTPPQPVAACLGYEATFQATGLASYNFQWQYSFGTTWTNFTNGSWMGATVVTQTNGGVSTLVLEYVGTNLNNLQVRCVYGGTTYTTPAATLTVVPTPIIYVDATATGNGSGTSWSNAFTQLSAALTANMAGSCASIIEVAAGTYTSESGPYYVTDGTVLFGGFPPGGSTMAKRNWTTNQTILEIGAGSPYYVMSIVGTTGTNTVVDGFSIYGGQYGIYTSNATPALQNLTVVGSTVGIEAEFPASGIVLSNCALIGCDTGMAGHDGTVTVLNCQFRGNGEYSETAFGAGLSVSQTGANATGSWSFEGCSFSANVAYDGGSAALVNYPATFRDCLFVSNMVDYGSATIQAGSPLTIVNCTIASNTTVYGGPGGGAIGHTNAAQLTIENSILWGNYAPSGEIIASGGTPTAANNIVQNGSGGAYVNVNPLLNTNFTLSSNSPAINDGNNAYSLAGETDIAGNPRVQQGIVDIGAYESAYNGSGTPVHGSAPSSYTACPGGTASFQATGLALYEFQWQYNLGQGWINLTNGTFLDGANVTVTSINGTSTLGLGGIPTNLNGMEVQAVYVDQSYTTPAAVLTVLLPLNIYVDQNAAAGGNGSSWATAYRDLGSALVAVELNGCGGGDIFVAKGTYTTTSNFLVSPHVTVYGGYPSGGGTRNWQANPVILNGAVSNIVVFGSGATNDTVLDGLVVQGKYGSGILVSNATPALQNLALTGAGLSAISVHNSSGLVISNCVFTNNLSAGNGAAINATNSTLAVQSCTFSNNSGANGGALYLGGGALTVYNSLFALNNASIEGGAIQNAGATVALVNCTVASNLAGVYGGGIGQSGGSATILNSILWGNNAASLSASNTQSGNIYVAQGSVSATNDIVEFDTALGGANVLNFDPLFSSGFALSSISPAINAGSNGFVFSGETDLAGNARVQHSVVDLGAYESASTGAGAISVGPAPLSVIACAGGSTAFQASGLPSYAIGWQYSFGGGWTNFASGSWLYGSSAGLASNNGISTLTLSNLSTNLTALQVHAVYSGISYTTAVATITFPPSVLYVDASAATGGNGLTWATAYNDLAPALATAAQNACDNVSIWVAQGTYTASAGYSIPAHVAVYGGFVSGGTLASRNWIANPTMLTNSGGAAAVTVQSTAGSDTVLDGFVVTGSSTGLMISNASPVIRNCQFIANEGIGAELMDGGGAFTNCAFQGNLEGALYATNSEIILADALVAGNAGGLAIINSTGTLVNSTVTANEDVTAGSVFFGGINALGSTLAIENSILWNNRSANPNGASVELQQLTVQQGSVTLAYASIESLATYSGTEVTNLAPAFVTPIDPAQAPSVSGDFQLSPCSPLIGLGSTNFDAGLNSDLAGNAREVGGQIDLGPYEFTGTKSASLLIAAQPQDLYYPTPGSNAFSISAAGDGLTYAWQIAPAGNTNAFTSLAGVPGFTGANSATVTVGSAALAYNGAVVRCQVTSADGCMIDSRQALLSANAITWTNPAAIVYGTALTEAQLNATASGPGAFMYTPSLGTVLPVGTNTLLVTFTPFYPAAYSSLSASVTIVVQTAPSVVTWSNPAPIIYGTPLSLSTQLIATANIQGSFVYLPTNGAMLNVGTYSLTTVFTPLDTNDYTGATNFVDIQVTPAPLSITANSLSKTYGQTLGGGGAQFTSVGLQYGETIGSVTLAIGGNGGAANAPVSGSPYAITPSAATGGTFNPANYAITYNAGALTVNPLPVVLTGTRNYDATTNAIYGILSVSNAVAGDDIIVASGSNGLSSASVGTNAMTSLGTIALGGASVSNYTLAGFSGDVIVTPLPVILTGERSFDGTATAMASILSITNDLDSTNLALDGYAILASTNAGMEAIVNFSPLDLTGSASSNYTLTGASGWITIDRTNSTVITWPTASPIVLGQTLAAATLSGGAATPPGNFAFTAPETTPPLGTSLQSVTYTPFDTNDYVAATNNIEVTVNNFPPSVTTLPASSVTTNSATLNGVVNPQNAPTTVSFVWGTTTNFGNTNMVATLPAETGGYNISNVLAGLQVGTPYFYAIVASNAGGVATGNAVSFTTLAPNFNQITGAHFVNGVFTLEFSGIADSTYILQATTNLASWSSISTNVSPASLRYFSDPASTNRGYRYYRVVAPQAPR